MSSISKMQFHTAVQCAGPIAAVRVARLQGKEGSSLLVNPSTKQLQQADMSILYAGTAERCTLFELQVPCNQGNSFAVHVVLV